LAKHLKIYGTAVLLFLACALFSQGEANKWYFGYYAGLNFNTSPPTAILTSSMPSSGYTYASISNAAGNLLFYTNGGTVWDQTNSVMANGTGLNGYSGTLGSQRAIILKKPGSASIYYIFTTQWNNLSSSGLYYSEVDMSLASGNGSVTVKNATIMATAITTNTSIPGKLTATRHCNGTDLWLVSRDWYYNNSTSSGTIVVNNSFRSFLITSAGVNTTAVVSSPTTYTYLNNYSYGSDYGGMKISPNGKKLGVALYNYYNTSTTLGNNNSFEMFDYDNTTGVVSNSLALLSNPTYSYNYSWGCEFSPDGTKFYGSTLYSTAVANGGLYQWDLCAGSPTAVVASIYTVALTSSTSQYFYGMQMAPDGKIYVSRNSLATLDVINNPNAAGASCNFSLASQSISPKTTYVSLPNFMNSYFLQHPTPTPFTFTVSPMFGCQTASFNSVYTPSVSVVGCAATGYSVTNLLWDFGDPLTGAANTSTLTNPLHAYSTIGTYTTQLILYYSCGGGTDTIRETVNINVPCITVNSTSITCAQLGSATVTSQGTGGPFSYTWMPSGQTSSVATGLSPGVYTITVHDFGSNFTYTASTVFTSLIPLQGNLAYSNSITCNGVPTGTASVTGITGGAPLVPPHFAWSSSGAATQTTAMATGLGAGTWNVIVTDAVTGCQINQTFFITQPPALSLNLSASSPTACAGASIALSGTVAGGSPLATGSGYTYQWTAGAAADTNIVSQPIHGNYVYTLTAKDSYSCAVSNTIGVSFIVNPALSIPNVSICPLQTGTLSVSGAASYTWGSGSPGTTFTDNPSGTTQYSVTGAALGCTSIATASIILKPVPVPTLSSNSPVCNGQSLQLLGLGGTGYIWTGPLSYTSGSQNPAINPAAPNNSGTYQATVTAANSCTAASTVIVLVNPTPTLLVTGDTICQLQTLHLTASTSVSIFQWTGPNGFTSTQQNPSIPTASLLATGAYTVKITSAQGCTNTAVAHASVVALPVPVYTSNSPQCFGSSLIFNTAATTGALSYAWSGPNSFTSSIHSPTIVNITIPAAGIYTLVVTTGPCIVSYTAAPVIINPLPVIAFTNDGPACEGKSIHLSASGTGTAYAWTGPASFTFTKQDTIFSPVGFSNAGIYSVAATDINGCVSSTVTTVSILSNPTITTTGDVVCLNQASTITASGGSTYEWSGPAGYISFSSPAVIPVTSQPAVGAYTVTGTAVNSCTGTATANVAIQPLPQPSLIVTPTVCVNGMITLQGFGGHTYTWDGPARFLSSGQTVSFTAFSKELSGTYSLTVSDSIGCKNFTTAVVNIYEPPSGSLVSSLVNHCVPFCSDFKLAPDAPVLNTVWQLEGRTFSAETFSYCFNKANNYILLGTFTGAYCTGTSSFVINAYEKPVAGFNYVPLNPVENNDHVVFTNTSAGDNISTWHWSLKDNAGNYNATTENASYLYTDAGTYPVAMVVSNAFGCSDTLIKLVTVDPDFSVYVPNTFTPNEDGKNESFYPVTRNASLLGFSVFDRWGTKIFSTEEPGVGWDGTYMGKDCQQDVYVWKLTVTGRNGELKSMTGSVTLLR
jgi:gliding motility-associated-like protein